MFLVLSKRVFRASRDKSLSRKAGNNTEKRAPGGGSKYYRFSGSTEGSAKQRQQSQRVRTLSRGVEEPERAPHRT